MDHLEKLLQALVMSQSSRGCFALADISEAIERHLNGACMDHDEIKNHERELEAENAELRRRLRIAGLNDKIETEEIPDARQVVSQLSNEELEVLISNGTYPDLCEEELAKRKGAKSA